MRALLLTVILAACGASKPGAMSGPTMNNKMAPDAPQVSHVVSQDILAREPIANRAMVKHILIAWKDLDSDDYHVDPRAKERSKADAEKVVDSLVGQLRAGADFDELMKANSEDAGSAASGQPFAVSPDAQLVIEFKTLGLRLNVGEYGVCESQFGFHIIKRVE
jgi:parvulin-like peptidyl-prolyl isomerase